MGEFPRHGASHSSALQKADLNSSDDHETDADHEPAPPLQQPVTPQLQSPLACQPVPSRHMDIFRSEDVTYCHLLPPSTSLGCICREGTAAHRPGCGRSSRLPNTPALPRCPRERVLAQRRYTAGARRLRRHCFPFLFSFQRRDIAAPLQRHHCSRFGGSLRVAGTLGGPRARSARARGQAAGQHGDSRAAGKQLLPSPARRFAQLPQANSSQKSRSRVRLGVSSLRLPEPELTKESLCRQAEEIPTRLLLRQLPAVGNVSATRSLVGALPVRGRRPRRGTPPAAPQMHPKRTPNERAFQKRSSMLEPDQPQLSKAPASQAEEEMLPANHQALKSCFINKTQKALHAQDQKWKVSGKTSKFNTQKEKTNVKKPNQSVNKESNM
ncbi:uncharacterized protein LOC129208682 [Grus americana]|uniref:uncharacterized protein LOC129208682 n=1 Tax=Grus americana TaxID=9117 RepID=UPI002407FEA9|nr:uncharacterized protein LOC129208682 [Grus americana]